MKTFCLVENTKIFDSFKLEEIKDNDTLMRYRLTGEIEAYIILKGFKYGGTYKMKRKAPYSACWYLSIYNTSYNAAIFE